MTPHLTSPAQQRYWVLQQLDSEDASAHTLSLCLQLDGPRLDRDRLKAALRRVIARHDVLYSTYRWTGEALVADVHSEDSVEIAEIGSRGKPTFDQAQVVEHALELASVPFDVSTHVPIRVSIVANGPDQTYLVLVINHMVWDAWSFGILQRELGAAYQAMEEDLPALPASYWDYAELKRNGQAGQGAQADASYWKQQLHGVQELPLIASAKDSSDQADGASTIHTAEADFGQDLREQILSFSRGQGITPFNCCVAAFQALMYRLGLGDEVRLGVPLADRVDPGYEKLIGCFLNTVVLRGSVAGAQTFEQLVVTTRIATVEALTHGRLPFETAARQLGHSRFSLYQAIFIFQNTPQARLAIRGVKTETVPIPRVRGSIEPTVTVWFARPEMPVTLEWNGALVKPADEMLVAWRSLLQAALARPSAPLDDLSLE